MRFSEKKPNIVVLCGPTAVGKTSVAIAAALACGGEIINADSVQIYRYLNVGTAKPSMAERQRVPHHLIDIRKPDEPFDAAMFAQAARAVIIGLAEKQQPAFVVGGTGLYIKALVHGLFEARPTDPRIRNRLKTELAATGRRAMYDKLACIDPETARKLHPNDAQRILRALEVFQATGKPISAWQNGHRFDRQVYAALKIGLAMDRQQLYRRIDARVDAMIQAGLLDEVEALLAKGYGRNLKSMQSIGYRHMLDYIEGRLTFDEAVRILKRDTRRYAKRQFTWFNKDPDVTWMHPDNLAGIVNRIRLFLEKG